MKVKKVPLRSCVITKEQLPKQELLRIVRTPEGEVKADETGKILDSVRCGQFCLDSYGLHPDSYFLQRSGRIRRCPRRPVLKLLGLRRFHCHHSGGDHRPCLRCHCGPEQQAHGFPHQPAGWCHRLCPAGCHEWLDCLPGHVHSGKSGLLCQHCVL